MYINYVHNLLIIDQGSNNDNFDHPRTDYPGFNHHTERGRLRRFHPEKSQGSFQEKHHVRLALQHSGSTAQKGLCHKGKKKASL